MVENKASHVDIILNDSLKVKCKAIIDTPQVKLRVEYLGDAGLGK
jgi:hypothetical protein